jgi:probable F420-dependent oxidoreductase
LQFLRFLREIHSYKSESPAAGLDISRFLCYPLQMRIGVIYPHFEFGSDPAAIRDYAQTAEELGFSHIGADDHVIGPNPERPGGWTGWVTYHTPFFEPFVLFGFMAAVTRSIEFATCVLLLPQRQTTLVAKQAAGVDLLSGGRLRLGIGIGWNEIEYISLGADFHNRGRRVEEQILLLRRLWTEEHVDFQGRWHNIPDAGINPLPLQRPIPLWFGGHSEPVIRRAARVANGWMPLYAAPEQARPGLDLLDCCLAEAGRTRSDFGLEARLSFSDGPQAWERLLPAWEAAGATHISLVTTDSGLKTADDHIQALRRFDQFLGN